MIATNFTTRLPPSTRAQLTALAELAGESPTRVICRLIDREAARRKLGLPAWTPRDRGEREPRDPQSDGAK